MKGIMVSGAAVSPVLSSLVTNGIENAHWSQCGPESSEDTLF